VIKKKKRKNKEKKRKKKKKRKKLSLFLKNLILLFNYLMNFKQPLISTNFSQILSLRFFLMIEIFFNF
jgi:hypothetical protein